MVKDILDADFNNLVTQSKGLVLLDFSAQWCGPCRAIAPFLSKVADLMRDKITIYKMDIDNNPETPSMFQVRSIPTLMLFKDGKKVDTKVGMIPQEAIINWVESFNQ